ncbi:MAG: hypothetical protein LH615_07465 [Ferruginibacter sp.]|nr:hypothetical protein [Ferruginibacter sp.]
MDLDDLKSDWKSISSQTGTHNMLTPKIIDQMISKKYNKAITKIKYPEYAGAIICMVGAGYIGFQFGKLNTVFLQATGITAMIVLVLITAITLVSMNRFHLVADVSKPYEASIKEFAFGKIRFLKLQKANVLLCYLLLVMVIVLLPKFLKGNDISTSKFYWTFSFSFCFIFLLWYSKWVKKYYNKTLTQAEELLKELE